MGEIIDPFRHSRGIAAVSSMWARRCGEFAFKLSPFLCAGRLLKMARAGKPEYVAQNDQLLQPSAATGLAFFNTNESRNLR